MSKRNRKQRQDATESSVDETRRKYLYRRMIVGQQIKLPSRLAKKLVGPDCAYHLYRGMVPQGAKSEKQSDR